MKKFSFEVELLRINSGGGKLIAYGESVNMVKVYPNPFDNFINLMFQAEASQDYYIPVYDLSGKKIVQESFTSKPTKKINFHLDLSQKSLQTGGVYLIFLESKNGRFFEIFKVVKK